MESDLRRRSRRTLFREWARQRSIEDLLCNSGHSRDFNGSRAEYIHLRLRLLCLAFAAMAVAWIPIDLYFLDGGVLAPILVLRLIFSAAFLGLGLWRVNPLSLTQARWRMVGFVVVPTLFYVASQLVLGSGAGEVGILVGYTFLPYLMVALMGIFPLTLLEGTLYALTVGVAKVGIHLGFGDLFQLATLGEIWLLGLLAGIALWAELAQLHMLLMLYREATRDALTGLVNRRPMTRWLEGEVARAQGEGEPLSLLLFDLDLFKKINDTHGHLAGDFVLQRFARVVDGILPSPDLIARWGGEEFIAALPGWDAAGAREQAERVRLACHEVLVESPEGDRVGFTVSIGVAELKPGERVEDLVNRVDQGLYAAKAGGRDMVVMAE